MALRAYDECLRQLLRSATWDFARKSAPMLLLADATMQTPNVGTVVPTPWIYEYAYPTDCVKARFVPQNPYNQVSASPPGNIAIAPVPQLTGTPAPITSLIRTIPARFLVATDFNYLNPIAPNEPWWEQPGLSPTGRTVILTNVPQAQLVYTAYIPYPNMWDPQFRAALVAYIASEIALPLAKDKKFGLVMRAPQIAIAKEKIRQARITDGNEGFYSSDLSVDWMNTRTNNAWGNGWGYGGDNAGCLVGGWGSCGFADGTAF